MSRKKMLASMVLSAIVLTILVFADPARGSQPTALAAAPTSAPQGAQSFIVHIAGAQFAAGASTEFTGTGIIVLQTSYSNANSLDAKINVAEDADTTAKRSIIVRNPDGGSSTCTDCFQASAGPHITSVSPASIPQGTSSTKVTVTGTGFNGIASVSFSGNGVKVNQATAGPIGNVGAEQTPAANGTIILDVQVASTATPGAHTITINTTDGGRATGVTCGAAPCFQVVGGKPLANSISPASRGAGAQGAKVAVFGRNFADGSTVTFTMSGDSSKTLDSGITVVSAVVATTYKIVTTLNIDPTAAPGVRDVTVTNADGSSATYLAGFQVNAAPTVGAPLVARAPQGIKGLNVTIPGQGFNRGARAYFGPDVRVERTSWTDTNSPLIATIDIAPNASASFTGAQHDVVVFNPDGGTGMCPGCFLVSAGPSIPIFNPTSAERGAKQRHIEVQAPNVNGPVTLEFATPTRRGLSGITVEQISPAVNGLIEALITVSSSAALGPRVVTLTASDGGRSQCSCFEVKMNLPIPSSTNPGAVVAGAQNFKVRVNGSNFAPGAIVSFSGDGKISTTAIPGNSVGTIYVRLNIAPDATPGPRDIVVTNPDGTFGTCSGCFTVNPSPKMLALTPPQEPQGTSHQIIQVSGVGFMDARPAITFSGDGITVHRTTNMNAGLIEVEISVSLSASPGARNVTLTGSDGSLSICGGCFTVSTGPV